MKMTDKEGDSKYRVAYDLMHTIASHEKAEIADRKYWVTLFAQSLTVVMTGEPERALRKGS
jgi:RNA-splicing ligase RtcB